MEAAEDTARQDVPPSGDDAAGLGAAPMVVEPHPGDKDAPGSPLSPVLVDGSTGAAGGMADAMDGGVPGDNSVPPALEEPAP
jgi:hypothetical protein